MGQPKWKLLWSTDSSALFIDQTGEYPPEMMIDQEDEEAEIHYVYRFPIPKLKIVRRDDKAYLLPENYQDSWMHPIHRYEEWFTKDLPRVAASIGSSLDEMIEWLTSTDPSVRSGAYDAIGGYHGFDNLDSYPQTWSEKEFKKKWPKRKRV